MIFPKKDLQMARSLEVEKIIPSYLGNPSHLHHEDEHQNGQQVVNGSDRHSPGDLAVSGKPMREGGRGDGQEVPSTVRSDMDSSVHGRNIATTAVIKIP